MGLQLLALCAQPGHPRVVAACRRPHRRSGTVAAHRPRRPRRDRLRLSGCDRGARPFEAQRAAAAARRSRDHRSRSDALLGEPRGRRPSRHASRVDRRGTLGDRPRRARSRACTASRSRPSANRVRRRMRASTSDCRAPARSSSSPAAAGASATSQAPWRRRSCFDEVSAVVCLCGRNETLRAELERRFGDDGRVRVEGFTDEMSEWMAAADALVHSTGGLTVLEAIMRGCPAISYGWGRGHVRVNNRAFRAFGLADVVERRPDLGAGARARVQERARCPVGARQPSVRGVARARSAACGLTSRHSPPGRRGSGRPPHRSHDRSRGSSASRAR